MSDYNLEGECVKWRTSDSESISVQPQTAYIIVEGGSSSGKYLQLHRRPSQNCAFDIIKVLHAAILIHFIHQVSSFRVLT